MRTLSKLLILIISLVLATVLIIYIARTGNLNTQIKYVVEYYFQLKNLDGKVSRLTVKDDQIIIDSITLHKNNARFKLDNIIINYSLDLNYKKSRIIADVKIDKITGQKFENEKFFNAKIKFLYNHYLIARKSNIQCSLDNILYNDPTNNIVFKEGKASIDASFSNRKFKYYVNVILDENVNFNLQGTVDNNIIFTGNVKNVPVVFYKPIYYLYPKNKFLIFCNDFIKSGDIKFSEFNINISKKDIENSHYTKENINGFAKISNLQLLYNNQLPPLTNMEIDISQKGMVSEFMISKAHSTDIVINDGLVYMDWKGQENTKLFITAKAQGPTKALTDFIAMDTHKALRQSSIDLTKFTGDANIDIKIEIPLKPATKDIYDITAHIPDTSLSIFANKIVLSGANVFGKYNGDTLQITGKGKINEFDSEINFIQNLADQKEFNHKLNIATGLQIKRSEAHKKIGFLTLLDGHSKLDFEYININQKGTNIGMIKANSDLKNLDLYFDKLGIHKKKGKKADFTLNGILESPIKGDMNFNVSGSNNLKIDGSIDLNSGITKVILDNINHYQTKLISKILIKKDLIDIIIKGKVLDLSNADMVQFLEKERDSGITKMQVIVDKVKLKNDIWLSNFKLNFACTSVKCYLGDINANIGSRKLELRVVEEDNWEKWLLTSSNAGALLKGISVYKDMRAGNLSLILKTSRKEIRAGEIIPIINGTFNFERFVLYDVSFLSKIVSFVSLPGFVNTISGNKNIIFSNMNGEFSFQNGVLSVSRSNAIGPFFDFSLSGRINTINRTVNLQGKVTPELYGLSSIIGSVPVIGRIFIGDKKHRGIIAAPYKIKDSY
ncbi:MAG: DUF3971 domain-containing protein [Rickettsiaceae bacterium]